MKIKYSRTEETLNRFHSANVSFVREYPNKAKFSSGRGEYFLLLSQTIFVWKHLISFLLGSVPPSNVVYPAFLFLTYEVCWTLKIEKSRQMKLWQEELSDLLCRDSLFDVQVSDLSVLPVNIWCQKTSRFSERSVDIVTETFAEPAANW